jgi:hypothetical protein
MCVVYMIVHAVCVYILKLMSVLSSSSVPYLSTCSHLIWNTVACPQLDIQGRLLLRMLCQYTLYTQICVHTYILYRGNFFTG